TVIIGVGVMAMLTLLAAGTAANEDATQLTEAINLANNIHEIKMGMPYYDPQTPKAWNSKEPTVAEWDNITDLDGASFNPPVDAPRLPIPVCAPASHTACEPPARPIPGYGGWGRRVEVESVTHDKVTVTPPDTTAEPT